MLRPNRILGYINSLKCIIFESRVAFGSLGTSGDRDLKVRGSNPSLGKELLLEGVADMCNPFNFCECYKCALLGWTIKLHTSSIKLAP